MTEDRELDDLTQLCVMKMKAAPLELQEQAMTEIIAIVTQHNAEKVKEAAQNIADRYYEDEYHKYPEFKTDASTGIEKAIEAAMKALEIENV